MPSRLTIERKDIMAKVLSILKCAKHRLITYGWRNRGGYDGNKKPCCVGLAIAYCGDQNACDENNLYYPATRFFARVNGITYCYLTSSVYIWNDAPNRTKDEVIAALDKAIAEAEKGSNA